MIIFILFLAALFIAGGLSGYFRVVQTTHLSRRRVFSAFLILLIVLTVMTAASWFGFFTQIFAIRATMSLYSFAAGFFIGYGFKLINLRSLAGHLELMHRSVFIDLAPNLIAAALFVFGIYRTGILSWGYFTGIGITSGVSLMAFAFLGWTVHIVPEFRCNGIMLLDQYVKWDKLVTFDWVSENTLRVEYFINGRQISEFRTFISAEDQPIIERLLRDKMDEFEKERKNLLNTQ